VPTKAKSREPAYSQ